MTDTTDNTLAPWAGFGGSKDVLDPYSADVATLEYQRRLATPAPNIEKPAPGVFQGLGSALADSLPYAAYTSASAWADIQDAHANIRAYEGAGYGQREAFKEATLESVQTGKNVVADVDLPAVTPIAQGARSLAFRREASGFAPNPNEVGVAGQIVHGVVSSLAKAAAYSAYGPAAPAMFGMDVGMGRMQELGDQGVDGKTAAVAGVISGAAGAIGMRVPAAMGATRAQSALIGAIVNPAINVAETAGIRTLLEHADYDKIADQYKPLDPTNIAIAALTGGAFGAAFHSAKAKASAETGTPSGEAPQPAGEAPKLTPEEHAATLTLHEAYQRNLDTLMAANDMQGLNVAREAQALARRQLDTGEPVSVGTMFAEPPVGLEEARTRAFVRMTDEMRGSLMADAGNLAERGDVGKMRAEIDQLTETLRSIEAGDRLATEIAFNREKGQGGREAKRNAQDTITRLEQDTRSSIERLEAQIEANRRAQQALQELQAFDRGEVPERFREQIEQAAQDMRAQSEARFRAQQDIQSAIQQLFSQQAERAKPATQPAAKAAEPAGPLAGVMQKVQEVAAKLSGGDKEAGKEQAKPWSETPEQKSAFEFASRDPEALVPTGELDADGNPVHAKVSDLIRQADAIEQQAKTDSAGFKAAVECALRFPQ